MLAGARLAGACVAGVVFWLASTCAASAQSAQAATLSSGTKSCIASTGCQMSLSGTGFAASETVDLTLHSTPSGLGTVDAGQNGDFVTTVTIPAGVAAGTHSIVAIGETSGMTAAFTFTLTAETTATTTPPPPPPPPVTTAPPAAVPPSPSATGALPFTGVDAALLVAFAVVAIVAGAAVLFAGGFRRLGRGNRVRG